MPKSVKVHPSNAPQGNRPYSLGVRQGNFLFVAGQVGQDFATGKPASDTDFDVQVRQAMDNMKAILEAGGSSLEKVVSTTCYITDIGTWARMNEIYATYFSAEPKPARATVESGLIPPYQFEISAIAYVDD
jgi:2-iminobutanoate/2-iminopropanoate deaminase